MKSTTYLLVFINGKYLDTNLERIAVKVDTDLFNEEAMQYYHENDNLKSYMRLDKDLEILRVEEIDEIIA